MLNYFVPVTRFKKLTLFTAIVTYALVVLGGIVRVTGSGLGCPDWPLCYGQPLPSQQTEAILEMAHRYVAALVTLLVIVVAVTAWRGYRQNKWIFRPAMAGAGVILFQIILGAITVLLKNHPLTVVAHFGAALTMLACATIIAAAARLPVEAVSAGQTPLRKWALLSVLFVAALLFFGALVTGTSSALGCLTDWPLCRGALIPNTTELSAYINWFHRFFALTTGLVLAYTTLVAWRGKDRQHGAWITATLMLSFFVIQAAIGGAVVLSQIHLVWRGLHLAMGAATWAAAIVLLVLAVRSGQTQPVDSLRPDPHSRSSSRSVGGARPRGILQRGRTLPEQDRREPASKPRRARQLRPGGPRADDRAVHAAGRRAPARRRGRRAARPACSASPRRRPRPPQRAARRCASRC